MAVLMAAPVLAGEYAVLSSGLRIHIERHEIADGNVRLYYANGGNAEFSVGLIARFEQDDYTPPPAPAPTPAVSVVTPPVPRTDPASLLRAAAVRYALPAEFVESVAKVESALKTNAVSPQGAVGVMQLMPETARALAADPNDPEQNIDAGTRLLRELLIKYNSDVVKALAAYNAGSGAVDRYQGLPPYPETQSYVDKVIRNYQQAGGQ